MTKWWKCDLQIATPAWKFSVPADVNYDISSEGGKQRFAERYVDELIEKGIEVVALADHNTGEWIDVMCAAGDAKGVVVFPGCEITTGSGSDGIHLIIVGDTSKTSRDFDLLLAGSLGFDHEHPRFHIQGEQRQPGSSGKTLLQILDDLPDDYLAIAPHALTENGIASRRTAQGDIRWKALHHPRLCAIDPGDCSRTEGGQFNAQFRRRDLKNFPRLKDMAFVYTSDAYEFGNLGSRFSWIRMESPSVESLRQAFLDPEARIICSWDQRLESYPDHNPNNIRHAWLKELSLAGRLGNSTAPITIGFHPGLNVLIGGRGSGKSTVVNAIRQIYSGISTLPGNVRQEAEYFSAQVFSQAELSALHILRNSQEQQNAEWTLATGSLTSSNGTLPVTTSFRIRVVNQKELFERVSHDSSDPMAASRSFLAFVDESIGLLKTDPVQPGSWWRRFEDSGAAWMSATREYEKQKADIAQLPTIRATIRDLEAQVAAFDSPDALSRRQANEIQLKQRDVLLEREVALRKRLDELKVAAASASETLLAAESEQTTPEAIRPFIVELSAIESRVSAELAARIDQAFAEIDEWRSAVTDSEWQAGTRAAEADERAYLEELLTKGIDPNAYNNLKHQLADQTALEKALTAKEVRLESLRQEMTNAWDGIMILLGERRDARINLIQAVEARSGRLRFEWWSHRDHIGWSRRIRDLLNLRSDAFLDDLPTLSKWIWSAEDDVTRDERWAMWTTALTTGDFSHLASREQANLRGPWQQRLESLDEALRLRVAAEFADDIVQMSFLRDGGTPEHRKDWQDITQGSPGQRTAAMLGFVLHHGDEPLVLDQPEDDLDTEWISNLVVRELRASRWTRQIIVVTHNANIPVNGDAERVVVLENSSGALRVRETIRDVNGRTVRTPHCGAIELKLVREDILNIMEGGIRAFVQRERKYNNEVRLIVAAQEA